MAPLFAETLAAVFESRSSQIAEEGGAFRRLRDALETIRDSAEVAALEGESAHLVRGTIRRVGEVAAAYDTAAAETNAAAVYAGPEAFRNDLLLVRSLAAAPKETEQLLAMLNYAAGSKVSAVHAPPAQAELAIDRSIVLQRLSLSVPFDAPNQVDALAADFELFRRRYESAYLAAHVADQAERAVQRKRLAEQERAAAALQLLNGIAALGSPVGAGLPDELARLTPKLTPCALGADALRAFLATQPRCPGCEFSLDSSSSVPEVDALLRDLQAALQTQQQRLGGRMVSHAVEDEGRPAFDRFLRAARASDVAALVAVMDESTVPLIRELLQD